MVYQRYVVYPASGDELHGGFQQVERLWKNDDGTAMFRIEADSDQWAILNSMDSVIMLPSLNAPANRHGAVLKAHFDAQGITAEAGDTTLNMLRKLRNSKGLRSMFIDHPY
jgi:hypothetical protein